MMNLTIIYGVYFIEKFHFERKRDLNFTEMFVEKVANVMVVEICGDEWIERSIVAYRFGRSMKMRSFNLV